MYHAGAVRKHRAPKGALRPEYNGEMRKNNDIKSESTEHQKVHQDCPQGPAEE